MSGFTVDVLREVLPSCFAECNFGDGDIVNASVSFSGVQAIRTLLFSVTVVLDMVSFIYIYIYVSLTRLARVNFSRPFFSGHLLARVVLLVSI